MPRIESEYSNLVIAMDSPDTKMPKLEKQELKLERMTFEEGTRPFKRNIKKD